MPILIFLLTPMAQQPKMSLRFLYKMSPWVPVICSFLVLIFACSFRYYIPPALAWTPHWPTTSRLFEVRHIGTISKKSLLSLLHGPHQLFVIKFGNTNNKNQQKYQLASIGRLITKIKVRPYIIPRIQFTCRVTSRNKLQF